MNSPRGPVRYFGSMPHGDSGTLGTTIPWIQRLIQEGKQDPNIQAFARKLQEENDDPADAAFRFVQSLPYRHDPPDYEMLQGAPYLLQRGLQGAGYSDCDCRVVLLNSLLGAMDYETRPVVIRGPGKKNYSHIYSEVLIRGEWVPADTIFPHFTLGQEVKDVNRSKTPIRGGNPFGTLLLVGLGLVLLTGR